MNSKIAQKLSAAHFKRRFGVQRATFKQLVKALKPLWRPTPKPGVKPKLTLLRARVDLSGILARVPHILSHSQQLAGE
jgi:hypothetical protein